MAEELTEEQINEFKGTFDYLDKNCNGFITTEDLGKQMISIGQHLNDKELQALLNEFVTDQDGVINFPEFLCLMVKKMKNDNSKMLQVLDNDGNELIPIQELKNALMNSGEKFSNDEIDKLINKADINDYGYINYQEFVKIMFSK